MKNVYCFCWLLAVATGCSKQAPPTVGTEPPPTATTTAESPAAPPRPPASSAAPVVAPKARPVAGAKPLEGRVDPMMTAQLKTFVAQKGRLPQSILELAGATSDGFPLAPAGYLYAIDPVSTEVKLIKQ